MKTKIAKWGECWRARGVERAGRIPEATLAEIAGKLTALLSG